jgi:hypothetical protein
MTPPSSVGKETVFCAWTFVAKTIAINVKGRIRIPTVGSLQRGAFAASETLPGP